VELGIEPRVVEFEGADALRHAVALNADRRQMKEAPRAMVAARLANMERGNGPAQRGDVQICTSAISLEDAAKMLGGTSLTHFAFSMAQKPANAIAKEHPHQTPTGPARFCMLMM
jgi:hypothetical protein